MIVGTMNNITITQTTDLKNWQKLDPNYAEEKQKYEDPVPSRQMILAALAFLGKNQTANSLAKAFSLDKIANATLLHRIQAMLRDDELSKTKNGRLRIVPRIQLSGKVFLHADGYGFFIPDDKTLTNGEDLFLPHRSIRHLMPADRVLVSFKVGEREGRVEKILSRATTQLIAKCVQEQDEVVVRAENKRITNPIIVSNLEAIKPQLNQLFELQITTYPDKSRQIVGKISRLFSEEVGLATAIEMAISNHQLATNFSEQTLAYVARFADEPTEKDKAKRKDLRDLAFITIDGEDARDFDDAVYARRVRGGFVLYVAIADVAHYVLQDSVLDSEAESRATSVYFPTRVIPMLPEKLSNGLCSLNPNVDRLALCAEIRIDNEGQIQKYRFYDAVIHSAARLTYKKVEQLLFKNKTDKAAKQLLHSYLADTTETSTEATREATASAAIYKNLKVLRTLYETLRESRRVRGAIDFEGKEPYFVFDKQGHVTHIANKTPLIAHQLIEECMIAANVAAARLLLENPQVLALFRNHLPNPEKLEKLGELLKQQGIHLKAVETITPKVVAEIVEKLKTHPNFESLQLTVLRSLSQAIYQKENQGHFGLALAEYAHFTSPIRRYPDLLVHRAIKHVQSKSKKPFSYRETQMELLGKHCSTQEREAEAAVYEVIAYLKCDYMRDKVGQVFNATIVSVNSFGFFAQLDDQLVDGLVHISSLFDDYFHYDEKKRVLIGEHSRKTYAEGDKVEVVVNAVSMADRRIDLVLTPAYLPSISRKKSGKSRTQNKKRTEKSSSKNRENTQKSEKRSKQTRKKRQ